MPSGYYGYDPAAFVRDCQDATAEDQRARKKDEFETTAEYQERLKQSGAQNPFTSKLYAFAAVPTNISYDADNQTFKLDFEPPTASHNRTYVSLLLKQRAEDMGSYVAQNAFGATFTVGKSLVSTYELWLTKAEGVNECTVTVKADPAEAKTMKPRLRALVVVRPSRPFASVTTTFSEPTFAEPHENMYETAAIYATSLEVRFYDQNTGSVLASCH